MWIYHTCKHSSQSRKLTLEITLRTLWFRNYPLSALSNHLSSNYRSCFCGPAFSGPAFHVLTFGPSFSGPAFSGISSFLVPHFQVLHFQSTQNSTPARRLQRFAERVCPVSCSSVVDCQVLGAKCLYGQIPLLVPAHWTSYIRMLTLDETGVACFTSALRRQ